MQLNLLIFYQPNTLYPKTEWPHKFMTYPLRVAFPADAGNFYINKSIRLNQQFSSFAQLGPEFIVLSTQKAF